ncbi:MAG TPA: ABC transporter ATP-binding protein [Rhodocyclaceae bacterium]|nr:ABC transporter ATP-binding protein [Rhodocyclaceae bacterium]
MILEARRLSVSIGPHAVCRELDLALAAGERLAILGRNGAGKSTLLATLAGLRPADGGELFIDGQSYADLGLRAAARVRGWLGQDRSDPFASTVLEAVLTGRHPHLSRWSWESPSDARIARAVLADMNLADMESREVRTLSGGERQRVAIAALLAQQTRLMLADEPLAHLDLNHQIATLELLSQRARRDGIAVALVLHDPNFALRYCDRALLLFGDGAHAAGPVDAVLDEDTLARLYGHPVRRITGADFPHAVFVPK